jgi:hypothetical protein
VGEGSTVRTLARMQWPGNISLSTASGLDVLAYIVGQPVVVFDAVVVCPKYCILSTAFLADNVPVRMLCEAPRRCILTRHVPIYSSQHESHSRSRRQHSQERYVSSGLRPSPRCRLAPFLILEPNPIVAQTSLKVEYVTRDRVSQEGTFAASHGSCTTVLSVRNVAQGCDGKL